MDEQARSLESTPPSAASDRGSAWAELDETFFRLVADLFPHSFCFGAGALLASNDAESVEPPALTEPPGVIVIPEARPSHEDALQRINQEIDRELALRRAAMRRHPSRRRF